MPESDEGFTPRLVDSLVDALVVIEDQGRVIYANPALGRLLGYRPDELFDRPLTDFLPERSRHESLATFLDWMSSDPPPRSPGPQRITMLHGEGWEIPVDIGTFLVSPEGGKRLVIAALWDARLRIDVERYQRVADELMAFLAGASGTADEVVPELLGTIATSLDFDFATAWRWDAESGRLHCEHTWAEPGSPCHSMVERSLSMSVRPGEGLAGQVVSAEAPEWHNELTATPHLIRHDAIVSDGMQSAFVFPIRTTDHIVGVVELFSKRERRPDRALFDAVAEVGTRLGDFIERLDLEAQRNTLMWQLERSRAQQAFLLRANLALAEAVDFRDAVQKLAEVSVPTLGDICLIDVVDPDGALERLAAHHADPARQPMTDELRRHRPDPAGSHPAALAIRKGEPQWSADMSEAFMANTTTSREHFDLTQVLGFHSYVSVPLEAGSGIIGALTMVSTDSGRRFGDEELQLAQDLARQVATAIERARIYDDQALIARHLQNSLLPPGLNRIPGLEVAVRYEASGRSAQIGGDFYDLIPLDDNRVAMTIGDVEGHDMIAATVMGQLRSAMRAFLSLDDDPGRTLALLDRFLVRQPVGRIATALIAVLDVGSGALEIASAGHPPPVVGGHVHPAAPLLLTPGPPLGAGQAGYPVTGVTLMRPAVLAFYTDGLIDEGRPGGSRRLDSLTACLDDRPARSCEETADAVLDELAPDVVGGDDIALMVVMVNAPATEGEG